MGDATARLDAALLGLDGFVIVMTAEVGGELELLVETTADLVGCPGCGAVARAKDRRPTWVRDLPICGRPVVLCWWKRVWCCPHPLCEVKTWTERHEAIASRACLTERARRCQTDGERSSRSAGATRRSLGSPSSSEWPGGR
jgi:transposase